VEQGPVLSQLREWISLGHTLRSSDDSILKQILQWASQGRGRPKNTWRRELEKEMWLHVHLEENGGTRQS